MTPSTPAATGIAYRQSAPLACGEGAEVQFSGRWWRAETAWTRAASSEALPGCAAHGVTGTMTLVSPDEAVFQADDGEQVRFRPTTVGCA